MHDKWLLGKIGLGEPEGQGILNQMNAATGAQVCLIIGTLIRDDFNFAGAKSSHYGYDASVRGTGWSLLQDWPHSFDAFLDNLVSANSSPSKFSAPIGARYGGLFGLLDKEPKQDLKPILKRISDHVRSNQAVSSRTRVLGSKLTSGKRVAIGVAVKSAGCSSKQFTEISKALKLKDRDPVNQGPQTVPSHHATVIKRFVAESIESVEIVKLLGCGMSVIEKLIDEGVLKRRIVKSQGVTGLIERFSFEKLFGALSLSVPEIGELQKGQLTPRQSSRLAYLGQAGIAIAMKSGHLHAKGRVPGGFGLQNLIFDRSELFEAMPLATGKAVSAHVLREREWKQRTLIDLTRAGYLDATLRPDYTDVIELSQFLSQHVDLAEMLRWMPSQDQQNELLKRLRECNISPVLGESKLASGFWPRGAARQALGLECE